MQNPSANKVWVEVSESAVRKNFESISKLLRPGTDIWAVIKSNAYGHGIYDYSRVVNQLGIFGFCVDSVIEGVKLREQGISKPILVLGPTLSDLHMKAAQNKITISISSLESLSQLVKEIKNPTERPDVHLKIDTGMHRQGLMSQDLKRAAVFCKKNEIKLRGLFSHFASAKDINYPTYCEYQFGRFEQAVEVFESAGFHHLKKHIAATAGTLINEKYHLNGVRLGIGLYGIFPSRELEIQLSEALELFPALSWRARISEIKAVPKGSFVGYDLSERVYRKTKLAIVPIGYWHGLPWSAQQKASVLIRGKRARVLGRVSMDLTAVDVTDISCSIGDSATIIGKDGADEISARELSDKCGSVPYEIITRINPLIERVIT